MARWSLILLVVVIGFGWGPAGVASAQPAAEISGRWTGAWRGVDSTGALREGRLDIDFAQDGARGRGRMIWFDTNTTDVPQSVRLAGGLGVPVVFVVWGSTVTLRHELGARQFAMQFTVDGDELVGTLETPSRLEIQLTRLSRPGAPTLAERVGRLEADSHRAGERLSALEEQTASLARGVEAARSAAHDAGDLARQALTAADESAQKIQEVSTALNGVSASPNGHAARAVVHELDVRFAFDRWHLEEAGMTVLRDVIDRLKSHPELTVELMGYADAIGSDKYNLRLSQQRVDAVYRELALAGVPLDRIHIIGLGALPGKAAEERAKNRRVTVKLLLPES